MYLRPLEYAERMDAWFKEFGRRPVVKYYHLTGAENETSVELEEFQFDTLSHRVTNSAHLIVGFKAWLDLLATNSVHAVPESGVPFLFHF